MDFSEPQNPQYSQNGLLNLSLDVVQADVNIPCGGVTHTGKVRTYNGQIPGPTLYVHPGDRLHITLHNSLPADDPTCVSPTPNWPHCFNTTNLHTHGLHVYVCLCQ